MERLFVAMFAGLAALAFTCAAWAQMYKWTDADGKVRYGDTPPPGVKATPIKGPSAPPPPTASVPANPAAKDQKPLTPEQAFRKRQQEREEADKKSAQARQDADIKRANCDAATAQLRTLQSGVRMSTINAQGERVYVEDDQRAQETARAQQAVAEWCK